MTELDTSIVDNIKNYNENIKNYKSLKMLKKQQTVVCFDNIFGKMSFLQAEFSKSMKILEEKRAEEKELVAELIRSIGCELTESQTNDLIYYLIRGIDPLSSGLKKKLNDEVAEVKHQKAVVDQLNIDLEGKFMLKEASKKEIEEKKLENSQLMIKKQTLNQELAELHEEISKINKQIEEKDEKINHFKEESMGLKEIYGEELYNNINQVIGLLDKYSYLDNEMVSELADKNFDEELKNESARLENLSNEHEKIFESRMNEIIEDNSKRLENQRKKLKEETRMIKENFREQVKEIEDRIKLLENEQKDEVVQSEKDLAQIKREVNKMQEEREKLKSELDKLWTIKRQKREDWLKKSNEIVKTLNANAPPGTGNTLTVPLKDPNKKKKNSFILTYLGFGGGNSEKKEK